MAPHSDDGEGPGQLSVQGREEARKEADAAEDRRELVLSDSGGNTGGSGARGDTEVDKDGNAGAIIALSCPQHHRTGTLM